MTLFEQILRNAVLKDGVRCSETPSAEEYAKALQDAVTHQCTALCYDSVQQFPSVPDEVLRKWGHYYQETLIINEVNAAQTKLLLNEFENLGLDAIALKGADLAAYYPDPGLRFYQDIDIWIRGPRAETIRILKDHFEVSDILTHECKVRMGSGAGTDVHFIPSKFDDPFKNRRLRNFFGGVGETDTEFYLVYCLVHIYRHLIHNQLTWKSLVDYYYLLQNASEKEIESSSRAIRDLGIEDFAKDISRVLQYEFGDSSLSQFTPGEKRAIFVRDQIGKPLKSNFLLKTFHILSFTPYYRREVLFSFFARISQAVWRWFCR